MSVSFHFQRLTSKLEDNVNDLDKVSRDFVELVIDSFGIHVFIFFLLKSDFETVLKIKYMKS